MAGRQKGGELNARERGPHSPLGWTREAKRSRFLEHWFQ